MKKTLRLAVIQTVPTVFSNTAFSNTASLRTAPAAAWQG